MTQLTGLVAGTVFYTKDYFKNAEVRDIETEFGFARILLTDTWAYVPRHGLEGERYIHAFNINHAANMAALKSLGVNEIIGVNSSGSLRPSLEPGSVVLPNDYICLNRVDTIYRTVEGKGHITPCLSQVVRSKLRQAADRVDVHLLDGGVYWQTSGPRLETKGEIHLLSHYADMVGMTLASEATISQELGLEYAALCSVDNHAHGLSPTQLTAEQINQNAAANADTIMKIIQAYLEIDV